MPKLSPISVGLPVRPFLYSLDQVANICSIDLDRFKRVYVYYFGRTVGAKRLDFLEARNIAPNGEKPEWRVAENELVRWMRNVGFRVHDRSWASK